MQLKNTYTLYLKTYNKYIGHVKTFSLAFFFQFHILETLVCLPNYIVPEEDTVIYLYRKKNNSNLCNVLYKKHKQQQQQNLWLY